MKTGTLGVFYANSNFLQAKDINKQFPMGTQGNKVIISFILEILLCVSYDEIQDLFSTSGVVRSEFVWEDIESSRTEVCTDTM